MRNKTSTWVRQERNRAKKYGCEGFINLEAVITINESFSGLCAYCDENPATTFDHPFVLSRKAPGVAANCIACCSECKKKKHGKDLLELHHDGLIGAKKIKSLLKFLFDQDGGDLLREYVKTQTGFDIQS